MARTYTYEFPRPSVTVDCVIFGISAACELQVLLIRRGKKMEPFYDYWALPGGFVNMDESLDEAAARELKEETGAEVGFLEQLYTFGAVNRDPRTRVIDVAYMALVRSGEYIVKGADDAAEAKWFTVPAGKGKYPIGFVLAFDHDDVLRVALKRLRAKVRYEPIGFNLLPEKFTLRQLQKLYEAILGRDLDRANFRKRVLDLDVLVEAGLESDASHPGRPAKLYRFNEAKYKRAVKSGVHFEI